MKIICVGRNYQDHAKELNNPIPSEPVIFMKPDTALLGADSDFYIPSFSTDIHHELELVVKINKVGKHIQKKFAHMYYQDFTVGIDFTARDLQSVLKSKGLPWEKAKSFDGSAPLGEFKSLNNGVSLDNIDFSLNKNGVRVQSGNTKDMLFSVDEIICYVSAFFTLKIGDLIYTGTPSGVGKVEIGDVLDAFVADQKRLTVRVK